MELGTVSQSDIRRVCSDAEAVEACALFLRDHNMLVEPSCGATLSAGIKYTHLRSSTLICTRYVLRMIC